MKSVKVEDSVGMVLAHDFTKIIPGGLCQNCSDCRYPNCTFGK